MQSKTDFPDKSGKSRFTGKNLLFLFIAFLLLQNISYAQIPGSFVFEGRNRNYEVFLPQNFQPNMPVVFALHGYTGSISMMKSSSKMHEAADTLGFVTVYPQSASVSWNTGETEPPYGWGMYDTTVNDVGFLSALIDVIYGQYEIDLDRVYVCGFSSGGEMTFRLAIELGDRLAAAASISGPLNEVLGSLDPIRPFPILHMHGTADAFISYEDPYYNLWSVEETLNFWIENNGCSLPADTILLFDDIYKISYTNCTDSNIVVHYKFIGGGHNWPVTPVNASAEILNFFMNYVNPSVKFAAVKSVEIFPGYVDPLGDTLFIKAYITNPENHSVSVYAKILGEEVSFSDSLMLYDDGLHYDENPNDNIYGNAKWLSNLEEDLYKVDIYTHDLVAGTIYKYYWSNYFTTAGPLKLDSLAYLKGLTNYYNLRPFVRNDGTSKTITGAKIKILCNDPWVSSIGLSVMDLPDIAPGETVGGSSWCSIQYIDSLFDEIFNISVEITVGGCRLWTDSIQVIITGVEGEDLHLLTYSLEQNYPNPFNPSTTINYQIPELSFVTIKVYDVLGSEIITLVNEEKPVGSYEVELNAENLPSGVYFYQLKAGEFVETKKMILIK